MMAVRMVKKGNTPECRQSFRLRSFRYLYFPQGAGWPRA